MADALFEAARVTIAFGVGDAFGAHGTCFLGPITGLRARLRRRFATAPAGGGTGQRLAGKADDKQARSQPHKAADS